MSAKSDGENKKKGPFEGPFFMRGQVSPPAPFSR